METIKTAVQLAGGAQAVVDALGIKSTMAISQWYTRGLPVARVIPLAQMTGWKITPHQLDPKHYPHPDDGLPDELRGAA